MTTPASIFSEAERRAWRPPAKMRPSEWAERHRRLSRRQTARPGPWKNAAAPYLAGIMDLCGDDAIEEIVVRKSAQIGVSEAVRNVIGYFAQLEPDPMLLVLADEESGIKVMNRRIHPLFTETATLAELLTERKGDVQNRSVTLSNGFVLSLGWSGSPATLAIDPQRIVIADEVDKWQEWSGREANPVDLARVRTTSYANRKRIFISTPTTAEGMISRLFDDAPIQLWYFVPCPHCGRYQRLNFDRLKWHVPEDIDTDKARAAYVAARRGAAWYECAHCSERIEERHRPQSIRRGAWAVESVADRIDQLAAEAAPGAVRRDGWPEGQRVALHLSSLHSLWVKLAAVAAEFIRSKRDPAKLMSFRNNWLGETFEQRVAEHAGQNIFALKARNGPPAGIVPNWAKVLLATADVQVDHFYYVVRAWGVNHRSQRVAHGIYLSFDELRDRTLNDRFQIEQQDQSQERFAAVRLLGIDAGYRTQEVYQFVLRNRPLARSKGRASRPHNPCDCGGSRSSRRASAPHRHSTCICTCSTASSSKKCSQRR